MGFYSTPGPLHLSLVRDLRSTQKPDLAIKSTLNKIYLQGGFFIVIIFLLRQFYARSHWETNKGWKEEVGEGPSLWGTAWCASGCINQVSTFPNNNNNKNQAVQQRQRDAGKTAPTDGAQEQWDSLLPHHTTATHTPSPRIPVMAPTESRSNLPPPAIGSAHPLLAARTSIFCSTSNHYGHHFFLICPSCTVCEVLPPKSIYKYAYPNFTWRLKTIKQKV